MGLRRAKILIVDDDQKDGQKIADALWKSGSPVLFVHYTEAALRDKTYGVHSGVRVIFLDINLTGDGIVGGGSHLYSPAEQALRSLLDDNNGPFALISWSSHDDEAVGLYDHLRERLPEGKRPVSLDRMDKDKLLQGDNHEEIIKSTVLNNLSKHDSLRCLTVWEGHVQNSSAALVKSLAIIADNSKNADFNKNLECLLMQLAGAEAGKWLDKTDDIASPLYSLMSTLLGDRLSYIKPDTYSIADDPCKNLDESDIVKWKCEINTFLHFDSSKSSESVPGSLFVYPLDNSDVSLPVINSKEAMNACIRGKFLDMSKGVEGYENRKIISEKCELLLMDVTPPCDHSNKKVQWRRFIVVCKVPVELLHYLWQINRGKKERIEGKLKGDHLRLSPQLSLGGNGFVLVFNANLQGAIPEPANSSDWETILGERKGRIREQLLSDLMGWLGSHITRGGYVELRHD